MSKSTFRNAGSRTPRSVISHFGAHRAGEYEKYTPRHAAKKSSREGYFPGGDVIRLAAGLAAIAATAIGATTVGASIDEKYDKADMSIQQPEGRESTEDTDTLPQPAGLDTFVDRPAEEDTIVDGGSYVTSCSLRQQVGLVREDVICVDPNLLIRPGARPADESNSNMPPANVDSRKQPTSA